MLVPGSASPLLFHAPAGGAATAGRSIRLNAPDSAYLSRTPASAGNRKTFTWSGWVKRSNIGVDSMLFAANNSASDTTVFRFTSTDKLRFFTRIGTTDYINDTVAVFRDPSAWYHVVCAVDTTAATAADRVKLYVNGVQVTFTATPTIPQNSDTYVNNTNIHYVGALPAASLYNSGYLALVHFIDGQALTPSSFGETSATTGRWEAKTYAGTYSGNSFFLDFLDNSAATATTLGADKSGLGNNWVPNNLRVTNQAATQNYTSGLSVPGGAASGYPYSNVFDADTSNYFVTAAATTGTTWTFTPSTAISATTLVIRVSQGARYRVNGGSWTTYSGGSSGELNLSSSITGGSITSIQGESQGNYQIAVWYIVVNGNTLTETNADTTDSLRDHPTSAGTSTGLGGEVSGNYATLNPLTLTGSAKTYANGNLEVTATSNNNVPSVVSTFGARSGKWYAEVVAGWSASGIGFINADSVKDSIESSYGLGTPIDGWTRYGTYIFNNGVLSSGLTSIATNDLLQLALDLDNGKAWFGINGTWENSGNPANGTNPSVTFTPGGKTFLIGSCFRRDGTAVTMVHNYGARAFAYTAPSGFSPLVDTLLPTPTIAKPNTVMDVVTYLGNGTSQSITGLGFSPDFVWIKRRSTVDNHRLFDTVRGATKQLFTDVTDQENTNAQTLSSFDSTGFSLGDNQGVNAGTNNSYVAWNWDAGSSNATNTSGTITSTVRANISAGFSVVSYTGTGANASVGHSLGVAPSFMVVKNRDFADVWMVYHSSLGATKYIILNRTDAAGTASSVWNDTAPTSSVFSIGSLEDVNRSSNKFIAYCWAPVSSYSSFGQYTGNGSSDGPFVYTGFRPRWLMIKSSSTGGAGYNWVIVDTARDTYNLTEKKLYANLDLDEVVGSNNQLDILSNGFKLKSTNTATNSSSVTYVYACFAENPFAYSRAR